MYITSVNVKTVKVWEPKAVLWTFKHKFTSSEVIQATVHQFKVQCSFTNLKAGVQNVSKIQAGGHRFH